MGRVIDLTHYFKDSLRLTLFLLVFLLLPTEIPFKRRKEVSVLEQNSVLEQKF